MTKTKTKLAYSGLFGLIAFSLAGLLIPFTMAIFQKEAQSDGVYGKVSLRSYFDSGNGTVGKPYVIAKPRHLYNLSRLQSFGVFDTKTYFRLGREVSKDVYRCIDDHGNEVPFLDMAGSRYDFEPIKAIGSEAKPFYGDFDGKGLEIKNLTVFADPEDAGLFGYTGHGSKVHNLFLSNVTINAMGYTNQFSDLYAENPAAASGTSFSYVYNGESPVTFDKSNPDNIKTLAFDGAEILGWNGEGDIPEVDDPHPVITYNKSNPTYKYKLLISGDFLSYVDDSDQSVEVDLQSTYNFFRLEKLKNDPAPTYPINASSSVSLVVSKTDSLGLDHSKVISTLDFDFSLANDTTTVLSMKCHLGEEHTDNIGLIIGHCDGTIEDCYASSGTFIMNDGYGITGDNYNSMKNGSSYGLIGKIGGTVHNYVAEESDGAASKGKSAGVLDFSTLYDQITYDEEIDGKTSFDNSADMDGGITYEPDTNAIEYLDYLRSHNGKYITEKYNNSSFDGSVSLRGRSAIKNDDLGVFAVATDYYTTGMDAEAGARLDYSVVRKEKAPANSKYYVYYATGEFDKSKTSNPSDPSTVKGEFAQYRESMKTTSSPSKMHLGYHFPRADEITSDSFEQRDLHQNYFFRFQIDSVGRKNSDNHFYFSDVNQSSPGGSFISKYFEHKLCYENGEPILASSDSKRKGMMLKDSLGYEIDKLDCSFATPDMSGKSAKMYCITNAQLDNPVANMVNFEIKTDYANVAVVAGLVDNTKPAAVGIYQIDRDVAGRGTNQGYEYVTTNFENPDYAFFMPTDNKLAYFDYAKDPNTGKYDIGTYEKVNSQYVFRTADIHTDATVSQGQGINEKDPRTGNETRLYAHIFKLKAGKYCIGSATGPSRDSGAEGLAKIYYVCAQGQTDGQLDFDDNAYASHDEVKNIDFLKSELYTITNQETGAYSSTGEMQRCYISLVNSDRSTFKAALCRVKFEYNSTNGYFAITSPGVSSTADQVEHMAVSSYAYSKTEHAIDNTRVKIFDGPVSSTEETMIYYPSSPPSP